MSSQVVNPAVLKGSSPQKKTERYGNLPLVTSTAPAYAAHQPSTSQVLIKSITRKTDPHIGSLEYYSSGLPGIQILRRYNNIFIPQITI